MDITTGNPLDPEELSGTIDKAFANEYQKKGDDERMKQLQEAYTKMGVPYAKEAPVPKMKEELERSDFRKTDLKGMGQRHYFSFKSPFLNLELCLEPCMNGFDVAIYKLRGNPDLFDPIQSAGDKDRNFPDLIEKKVCTNVKLGDDFIQKELMRGTQEREKEVWNKALKIANKFYREFKNEGKLKKWGMIPDEEKNNGMAMGTAKGSYS